MKPTLSLATPRLRGDSLYLKSFKGGDEVVNTIISLESFRRSCWLRNRIQAHKRGGEG